jgi:putative sigma-54 modulation protein
MQFSVTFRHMEATDAIKEYAREKVDRVKKYFPDPIMVHVVLSTERGYQHAADVNIQLHNGLVIKGHETTEDMYSSIDLVMAKIERQVRRYKEKIRGHKARADLSVVPIAHHILEAEGIEAGTVTATAAGVAPAEPDHRVVRTEKVFARPLSVNEAIMQLNLLGDLFLVFRHEKSGQITVVYKRNDGAYGLIETGAAG